MQNSEIEHINKQLKEERIIWLSTVRPDGRPHLVPIWFYWTGEYIYFTTFQGSRKLENLMSNHHLAMALPDGGDVVILEGTAEFVDGIDAQPLFDGFLTKYGSPRNPKPLPRQVVKVKPNKFLAWGGPDDQRDVFP